ncbi:FecR family protein [Formosa undariae]|uniref:FecR family protein n=1 Tax=Formosa undariae TaxID=1325436 RepID=A0ABV5F3L3_9FLAO
MKENLKNKVKILPITRLEKTALKNKIFNSLDRNNPRKRYKFLAIAAMVSVVFCATFYLMFFNNYSSSSSITEFVNSTEEIDFSKAGEIVLILGNGENLEIEEDKSNIQYSNSGKTITIGGQKEIKQEISRNNKKAFNTIMIPYGKRSKIMLSDGTTVWLNSGSKLVYPVAFNSDRREVYLEGEAIFDVSHDKNHPFIVLSSDQEIEVLGTVFGVTNYTDERAIKTVLKSGSVQISYHNDPSHLYTDKIKITPGTKATYNKSTKSIVSEKVNVDNYFSWREGVLVFQNNDLEYVINRISKFYNMDVEIQNKELLKERFSGSLDLNESIHKVIENIALSTNLNYIIKDDKVIIN